MNVKDIIFMPSEVRLEKFLKNIELGLKIHCLTLKLYTGASKSGVGEVGTVPGPTPGGSACDKENKKRTKNKTAIRP